MTRFHNVNIQPFNWNDILNDQHTKPWFFNHIIQQSENAVLKQKQHQIIYNEKQIKSKQKSQTWCLHHVCLFMLQLFHNYNVFVQIKTHVMKERNLARENEQRFYEINSFKLILKFNFFPISERNNVFIFEEVIFTILSIIFFSLW